MSTVGTGTATCGKGGKEDRKKEREKGDDMALHCYQSDLPPSFRMYRIIAYDLAISLYFDQ
jgi:hypothetical protein